MTDDDIRDLTAWRNLVADWHLRQQMPLDCGCNDDTEDHEFCSPSTFWADEEFAARTAPELDGPPDKWNHDIWIAAWGYNATVYADYNEYKLPVAPKDLSWLATRMLIGGRQAVELAIFQLTENRLIQLCRKRADAEPSTVAALARRMLQETTKERGTDE